MKKTFYLLFLVVCLAGLVWGMGEKEPAASKKELLDFTLPDLAGKPIKLSDYRGKVIMLNFWATWCPPCRSEMPIMQKLHEKMADKPFVIVAVNLERGAGDAVCKFVAKEGYTFKVLLDNEGEVAGRYSIYSIPTTYVINKKGKVVDKLIGARDWLSDEYLKAWSKLIEQAK
ncbi:MAG: TlpA disulfide reductase family protein [Candidatus Margulisiibacteriota bacterium]